MTKEEALNFIGQCGRQQHSGRRPSDNPRRTRLLLDKLGSPDCGMRMIHVCGSNGKGSVCAMLEAVLRAAGYSVGMFISPHIQDVCERIRINGQMISDHDFGIACEKIRGRLDFPVPDMPCSMISRLTAMPARNALMSLSV